MSPLPGIKAIPNSPEWTFRLKIIILVIVSVFSFWRLGAGHLRDYDESWYGVFAIEQIQHNDPINYYFGGEPEFWNAKTSINGVGHSSQL